MLSKTYLIYYAIDNIIFVLFFPLFKIFSDDIIQNFMDIYGSLEALSSLLVALVFVITLYVYLLQSDFALVTTFYTSLSLCLLYAVDAV